MWQDLKIIVHQLPLSSLTEPKKKKNGQNIMIQMFKKKKKQPNIDISEKVVLLQESEYLCNQHLAGILLN